MSAHPHELYFTSIRCNSNSSNSTPCNTILNIEFCVNIHCNISHRNRYSNSYVATKCDKYFPAGPYQHYSTNSSQYPCFAMESKRRLPHDNNYRDHFVRWCPNNWYFGSMRRNLAVYHRQRNKLLMPIGTP